MPKLLQTVGFACYLTACVGGLTLLAVYDKTPARAGTPPTVAENGGRPRVVVAIHPKCPCTVASLRVVEGLWVGREAGAELEILVVVPEGAGADFAEAGAAVEAARRIAGAGVVVDAGGARARRLGATASGQVVAYDGEGRMVFSGGVTVSRGHAGDADVSVLRDLLAGKRVVRGVTSPVFGCALAGE